MPPVFPDLKTRDGKHILVGKKYKFTYNYQPEISDSVGSGGRDIMPKPMIEAGTVCEMVNVFNGIGMPYYECKFTKNGVEYTLSSSHDGLEEVVGGGKRKNSKSHKSRKSNKTRKSSRSRRN